MMQISSIPETVASSASLAAAQRQGADLEQGALATSAYARLLRSELVAQQAASIRSATGDLEVGERASGPRPEWRVPRPASTPRALPRAASIDDERGRQLDLDA